jgi:hypothetical protein
MAQATTFAKASRATSRTAGAKHSAEEAPFILLCRTRWVWELQALAGLLILVLASRFAVFSQLSTHILGGAERDAGLYLWLVELHQKALFTEPWFNTPAFYPYSLSLGWSDNFLLPSLALWPALALGASPIVCYNLLLLLAQLLNGYATHQLVFKLTGNRAASFLSGAAFLLCPALTAHLGHPQLQFFFFIPWGLLAFFSFLASPSLVRGITLSLVVVGAFLTTVYYSVFLCLLILILTIGIAALRPKRILKQVTAPGLGGLLLGALPLLPFLPPYLAVQGTFGERFLHEPFFFSANALSFVASSPFSLLLSATSSLSHSEAQLYGSIALCLLFVLGLTQAFATKHLVNQAIAVGASLLLTLIASVPSLTPLSPLTTDFICAIGTWCSAVAIIWFLVSLGRLERVSATTFLSNRALLALFGAAALILLLISFGPRGYSEAGPAIALYRFWYEVMPGFSAARAVGRLGLVVIFLFYVGAGLSFAFLQRRTNFPSGVAVILLAIVSFESTVRDYPLEEPPAPPQIFDEAALRVKPGESLVVLPFSGSLTEDRQVKSWSEFARLQVNAMRWALPKNLRIVNGYSGQRTKLMREWPGRLANFPSAEALKSLSELVGLRFVIVLRRYMSPDALTSLDERLTEFGSSLRKVATDPEGNILIEYIGTRVLDTDGAILLAPSYPSGVVTLELSAVPVAGLKELTVIVRNLEDPIAPPLSKFPLPTNGSWQEKSFRIGNDSYAVSPIRIGIKVEGDLPPLRSIYIRRSVYENGAAQ